MVQIHLNSNMHIYELLNLSICYRIIMGIIFRNFKTFIYHRQKLNLEIFCTIFVSPLPSLVSFDAPSRENTALPVKYSQKYRHEALSPFKIMDEIHKKSLLRTLVQRTLQKLEF